MEPCAGSTAKRLQYQPNECRPWIVLVPLKLPRYPFCPFAATEFRHFDGSQSPFYEMRSTGEPMFQVNAQ